MMSAVNSFHCLAYMTERFLATVFVSTYEKQRPYYGTACVLLMTLVSGYNAFKDTLLRGDLGRVSNDESAKFSTTTLIASYVNVLAVLLCMLAVCVLHKYAKRRQRRGLEDGKDVNLTERYQNSENLRTTRQLLPVIFLHFLTALFGAIYLAAAVLWPNSGTTYLQQVALGFVNCVLYTFCELALLHFNPALRVEAASRLRRFKQAIGSRSGSVAPSSGPVPAEHPALGTEEEANFYFSQLEDAWDRHYERRKNS
ncbi:Protein SRE-19 [Aphelenchoides avenae]|nr:Protein SRE-19 [Aphelenchus avenae]